MSWAHWGKLLDKVGAKIWGQIQIQAGVRVRRTAEMERLCQNPRAWACSVVNRSLAGAAGFSLGFGTEKAIHQMSPRRLPNQVLPDLLAQWKLHQEHQTQATRAQPGASRWPPVSWKLAAQTLALTGVPATSCSCPLTGGSRPAPLLGRVA